MLRLLILMVISFCSAVFAQGASCSMEAVLLGTGYPFPFPDRAGPSTALIVNGKYFVVVGGRADHAAASGQSY